MTNLYSVAALRGIEADFAKSNPRVSLMRRAGDALAAYAVALLAEHKRKKSVLVVAGPGNNGGDGWVAARALQKQKINVTVWPLGEQRFADMAAKKAHDEYRAAKGKIASKGSSILSFGLIIDGIFGIGLTRAPGGEFRDAIRAINQAQQQDALVLSIDIPSGLDADTGVAFADTVHADYTLTFLGAKPGLYTADGADCCGTIRVESLDVPAHETRGQLLTEASCAALIPSRRRNSHKGTYGNVGIIGGANGMTGAAALAARAALHMGPGKVYAGLLARELIAFDVINPEIMVRAASDVAGDAGITAFAIGMGAGDSKQVKAMLSAVLASKKPAVIDADALAFVHIDKRKTSIDGHLQAQMPENDRSSLSFVPNIVLTPHPGEAARLLDVSSAAVLQDRVAAACEIASRAAAITVLKGAGTVIATPDGDYFINTTGNPGMASGGMGDALSGMIAAFLAQGLSALDAAKLGVYLHGAAADSACHHGMGPLGLTASEVIFEARTLLNAGLADHHD
jgi:ADP-dependent NAD(P)H-hydrate dehydratase / NAD(P)H-hydrate epimerase